MSLEKIDPIEPQIWGECDFQNHLWSSEKIRIFFLIAQRKKIEGLLKKKKELSFRGRLGKYGSFSKNSPKRIKY